MTDLERQQRGLLDLVKNRGAVHDDAYLQRLAGSRELAMIRRIALWWRTFQLEAQCRYTSRLLKRRGCFDNIVADYFDCTATSPYIEELSQHFLNSLRIHPDPPIAAVSQFELALLRAKAGCNETFEVLWDRHPELVLVALENGSELPPQEPGRVYRMRIARDIPNLIACTREPVWNSSHDRASSSPDGR